MGQSQDDISTVLDRHFAAKVSTFLQENPTYLAEFLDRNPQLLSQIAPAPQDRGDGVVDLQSFMVSRLRNEVGRLSGRLEDVVQTSRSNLSAQALVHEAVLSLLDATSLDELIDIIATDMAMLLSVDVATLCIETDEYPVPTPRNAGVFLLEYGTVDNLIGKNMDARLDANIVGHPAIFGHACGLVRSQALLRVYVSHQSPMGMLALGTRREGHFDPSQGTELLCFLARVLGGTIRGWLQNNP